MLEVTGNLWEYPADAIVITTNGTTMENGENVMGGGCAREAKERYPNMPRLLGERLLKHGNHVFLFQHNGTDIVTMPTKERVWNSSTVRLIKRSAEELVALTDYQGWETVVVPRPGCGLGGLDWDTEVKPVLEEIFDDRFHVITFERDWTLPFALLSDVVREYEEGLEKDEQTA